MAKLCPFRKASWVPTPPDPDPEDPTFDPEDGSWLWVTGSPYNATGNGSTDDRAAIQACINAAASQSKGVYFPAGTYHMIASGGVGLTIPSNVTLRGVGDTSVLRLYDNGTDARHALAKLQDKSNVTFKNLKLTGTQTNKEASVQCIILSMSGAGCHNITVDGVTFDKGEYGVRCIYNSGASSSHLTVTDCKTLSNMLNPFYLAYLEYSSISGCDLDSNSVDCMPSRYPHHFYFNDGANDIAVSDCILRNGQHVSIDAHSDGGAKPTNLLFSDITFVDVVAAIYGAIVGTYHLERVNLRSSRYEHDYPITSLWGVDDFLLKNFDVKGGAASLLTENGDGCASLVFEYGDYYGPSLGTGATFTRVTRHEY